MSAFFRKRIEATIEHLIAALDEMDGDPDRELEPIEEQYDREDEPAVKPRGSKEFVLAEIKRRYKRTQH